MNWRAGFSAFMRNDVEYAPFGMPFLRGLTPARLAIVAIFCVIAVPGIENLLARHGLTPRVLQQWTRASTSYFVSAIPLVLLILWIDRRTAGVARWKRIASFAAAIVFGGAITALGMSYWPFLFGARRHPTWGWISMMYKNVVTWSALCCVVLYFLEREREAARELLRSRLARVATERQIVEARLQLLKAQIEPHFLFNSLASVKLLYEQEQAGGRQLLRNLGSYLRTAVRKGRDERSTLADEVAMARTFLEILKERMGERLQMRIDVPAELQLAQFPTLMLGTLVENAVKHGIAPRGSGGSIGIRARRDGARLVVEVSDDGLGFQGESGTGVGLANTRARLESMYPGQGELELDRNDCGGVTATIAIPLLLDPTGGSAALPRMATAAQAEPAPAGERGGFLRRFARILTWKHWAWATGVAVAFAVTFPLGGGATPYSLFTPAAMLDIAATSLVVAWLAMLAIVAAEASRPDREIPSAGRYFAGWLAVCAAIGFLSFAFPDPFGDWQPRDAQGQQTIKRLTAGGWDPQLARLFASKREMIEAGLAMLIYVWLRNARRASEALTRAEIERTEAERKLIASQLEAVEAEVDPAFMFSMLETIENTYERDRVAAGAMLDELIAFLRAAIPKLRTDSESKEAIAA